MSQFTINLEKQISKIAERKQKLVELFQRKGYVTDSFGDIQNETNVSKNYDILIGILKNIKVAAIMDSFTVESYRPECNLFELTADNWKEEIESFVPDILFIESAWHGKESSWYSKVSKCSKEFFEMTTYCHEKEIPVVFWNKEDPVYTDTFMQAAKMADFVFTTDIDCISRYKEELGHGNVFHLHFAAQPKVHNPIEKYERKDKFCFAGAYYHRYKERMKVFNEFAEEFISRKGFDIYDRNYKNARPEHAFPKEYNKFILGTLVGEDIDKAYKGYEYGVNMNSVQQSQTMFARRVFEMLASNTVTIGNYSRGVRNYFGDLTICTDDNITLNKYLKRYCEDENTRLKYKLAGLRAVLKEHTYEMRLAYIVSKVFNKDMYKRLPSIVVLCKEEDNEKKEYLRSLYNKQTYKNTNIIFITAENDNTFIKDIVKEDYISLWSSDDFYGENYLMDLILTSKYCDFEAAGKSDFYSNENNVVVLKKNGGMYRFVSQLDYRTSIIKSELLDNVKLCDIDNDAVITSEKAISTDIFNYCRNTNECLEIYSDINILNKGIELKDIESIAENIEYEIENGYMTVPAEKLLSKSVLKSNMFEAKISEMEKLVLKSELTPEVHDYLYFEKKYSIDDISFGENVSIFIDGLGDLDIIPTYVFLDINLKKISVAFGKAGKLDIVEIPKNTKFLQLGLRYKGSGNYRISKVIFGLSKNQSNKGCLLTRTNMLVLSSNYPSAEELYRNMFIHKRIDIYKEYEKLCDVMRMNIYAKEGFREFDGIDVIEGHANTLDSILQQGKINTVCVHFLDVEMWEVLKNYADKINIIVWLHGAEIHPWWRREFNYASEGELKNAKTLSDERMKFWNGIFENIEKYKLHIVFVSKYFANEVFEDYKISLHDDRYSIIHNCIDTDMFKYEEKSIEQRKKILSIRPYVSPKYGNDLAIKCIQELAKKIYFNELEIRLIGSGELFESTTKPLRKYKNVILEKRFLRQEEISKLHKNYGIFLNPTRHDTQGVSRDEAMSSGLVPVTSAVTAIPEFVDDQCAILAEGEDFMAMAAGIDELYNDAERFLEMSRAAAIRVRSQTSKEYTIKKEIQLLDSLG